MGKEVYLCQIGNGARKLSEEEEPTGFAKWRLMSNHSSNNNNDKV